MNFIKALLHYAKNPDIVKGIRHQTWVSCVYLIKKDEKLCFISEAHFPVYEIIDIGTRGYDLQVSDLLDDKWELA